MSRRVLAFVYFALIQYGSFKKTRASSTDQSPQTPKCESNEKLVENKTSCPGDSCLTKYVLASCVADQPSSPDCICNEGYLRNATGGCIPADECLNIECVNDPNAVKGCGNRCGKSCADHKDNDKYCAAVCSKSECDCRPGYIYDENVGLCVLPENCTPQCQGEHEEYTSCILGQCRATTCDELGESLPCPRILGACQGGCICKSDYLRDSTGKCIEAVKCPSCGNDTNAIYGCGNLCGKSCTTFHIRDTIFCAQYCETNGCDCREDFIYDDKVKKCVKTDECSDYGCPANATYVSCNAQCPSHHCPADDNPTSICDPPNACNGGCQCKLNYRLNSDGECILATECPPVNCTRPHEVFNSCPSACLAESCADRDNEPSACNTLLANCQPGCVCERDTWRNTDGVCVPANQCP